MPYPTEAISSAGGGDCLADARSDRTISLRVAQNPGATHIMVTLPLSLRGRMPYPTEAISSAAGGDCLADARSDRTVSVVAILRHSLDPYAFCGGAIRHLTSVKTRQVYSRKIAHSADVF
jgi:hypothetical protein